MSHRQHAANKQTQIEQNPIHVDSKWFKEVITITGSVEASLILSDCIIYYRNKYRGFAVDDQQQYGLLTSISEIQRNYNISYKRAKQVLQNLLDQDLIKIHSQCFIHNRKFYTPTDKALDTVYKLHFVNLVRGSKSKQFNSEKVSHRISKKPDIKKPISPSNPYQKKVKPPLAIDQSTFSDRQNSYKDKHKDKKNNNHNTLLKNYSLLENSQPQNVKTVIFDFSKFNLSNIQCEANILDYFTVKQSGVINTITYCYHETLDIVIFNQILNRPDLKKEAKDFKQLVTWAYVEATKENKIVATDDQLESDGIVENQNVNETVIYSCSESMAENKAVSVAPQADNHNEIILPEITADTIQAMIKKRQNNPVENVETETETEIKLSGSEVIATESVNQLKIAEEKSQPTAPPQSSYLLNQSNKLHLIETLSAEGINDAALILKTAENIIAEYPGVTFNDLLDGAVYRLVTLPEKQRQQELINQAPPMSLEGETENCVNALVVKEEITEQSSENNQKIVSDSSDNALVMTVKCMSQNIVDSVVAQEKPQEESKERIKDQSSEIEYKTMPDLLNQANQNLLFEGLNAAGISDEKLIIDTAKEIVAEYPDLNFKDLLEGVIYRLVTLPSKQKKQDKIKQSLTAEFGNTDDSKNLESISTVAANQLKPTQADDAPLPQLSDLTIPHADNYVLRQDWASKAEQNFYTGSLPDSQQLALVAMIDYVKRKGVTITLDQEVYEWLYHMVSNKDYYYSRAKSFKHWCNIVIRQLMQRRLHKPTGFDGWRSRIERGSLAVAA